MSSTFWPLVVFGGAGRRWCRQINRGATGLWKTNVSLHPDVYGPPWYNPAEITPKITLYHEPVNYKPLPKLVIRQYSTKPETQQNSQVPEDTDKDRTIAAETKTTNDDSHAKLIKEYTDKIALLKEEIKVLTDKYKRSLADTENTRVRFKKQIEEAKSFGVQGFLKEMLDVADVLEKAIDSVPEESLKSEGIAFNNMYEGVVATRSQLSAVFRRQGAVQILPDIGEKFNPKLHEAMFELDRSEDLPTPGTVAVVTKAGYRLHERTIRAAQVGVTK